MAQSADLVPFPGILRLSLLELRPGSQICSETAEDVNLAHEWQQ